MSKKIMLLLSLALSTLSAQMHSLVIGVNNGNLIGAENDAAIMNQLLANKGVQYRQQLYGPNATAKNIMDAFEKIVNHAKPNDWVYLFFSGHGTSPFDPDNRDKPQLKKRLQGTGALFTGDNKYLVIKESLAPLFRTLDKNRVRTIVIFDACFSGSAYKNVFNAPTDLPFYTPNPTRRGTYPYENLIYLSSTTYSDYASESSIDKRGYFSMAISNCLSHNHDRNGIEQCLDRVKNVDKKLPQTPVILPKKQFVVFPSYSKNITVSPTNFSLKEQLFNLAKPSDSFQLYAQNTQGITSKNYTIGEKFSIHLESKASGYFVLLQMGASKQLKLSFPNNQKMPYVTENMHKKILALTATSPKGEEVLGAFLVDKSTALALQKLYKETNGELLKVADIQKAMRLIEANQIVGSKLLWMNR